ncbi:MAG: prolyl oligopeptidase family serine peptidase, partial [Pseudomonadota bacterium]|nr:prolyl oligopeptidase family serine peptidase [Pseudomonadota bacterium]
IHGEDDALVKPRNSRALAAALGDAGAPVETKFYPGSDHNAPLISLASPWRRSRDVDDAMIAFARKVTTVSVPVQQVTD